VADDLIVVLPAAAAAAIAVVIIVIKNTKNSTHKALMLWRGGRSLVGKKWLLSKSNPIFTSYFRSGRQLLLVPQ
jgi:hypothetical protein